VKNCERRLYGINIKPSGTLDATNSITSVFDACSAQ